MGRLGIFGGTFNPIHNGHLHIAECFWQQMDLDSLLFIPSKRPTHKPAPDLASSTHRLAMCRAALEGTPFSVSDLEITRQSDSYTVYTLEELHRQYPEERLYLLMGEDMFLTLLDWKAPEEILSLCVVCVAPRSEDSRSRILTYGKRLAALGGQYALLDIPFLSVSSTEIRQRVQAGLPIDHLMPDAARQYLYEHHLYQGGAYA